MTEFAIQVKGLTKKFEEKMAVDHISLNVKRGSIFGFLGANGSGKTTTIRMICGLLTPTEGTGLCLGYDIRLQRSEIILNIGYMPQKFSFYAGLTVYENLRFIADIYQISRSKITIEKIMQELELLPYRNMRAASLSGGWKQRLALSCCLVHKPQLLFLDEPTAGVDPKARKEFWDYLHKISIEEGTTVLVTTHYMDEAEKCTELAYINLGKLLYAGSTNDLIPQSQVKTYALSGERETQGELVQQINSSYPELLTSIVSNDLRVSSRNDEMLNKCIKEYSRLKFRAVTPSFEEVFIGLMQ